MEEKIMTPENDVNEAMLLSGADEDFAAVSVADRIEEERSEIRSLIDAKDYSKVRKRLDDLNEADIAEVLEELPENDQLKLFRILPKDMAADVFAYLPIEVEQAIITSLSVREAANIVNNLMADDAADLMEEMPATIVKKLLANASAETRRDINHLLRYPDDSAGSIMTVEFVDLKVNQTVAQCIDRMRKIGLVK